MRKCDSSLLEVENCIGLCNLDDSDCYENCKTRYNLSLLDCIAKRLGLVNFNSTESYNCSKTCNYDLNLDVLYDCDIGCKSLVYDKLLELEASGNYQVSPPSAMSEEQPNNTVKNDQTIAAKPTSLPSSKAQKLLFNNELITLLLPLVMFISLL